MVAVDRKAWRGAWMRIGALDQSGDLYSADVGRCCELDVRAWIMSITSFRDRNVDGARELAR